MLFLNCEGLGNLQDELFTWLEEQPYHIVPLQESWYKTHVDFRTRGWSCINSLIGSEAKHAQAGVMVLLRENTFPQQYIRYHHVVPGRLLHVNAWCNVEYIIYNYKYKSYRGACYMSMHGANVEYIIYNYKYKYKYKYNIIEYNII